MNTGKDGIAVMHYFEALKLMAYPDPASPLFAALQRAGIDPYKLASVPAAFAGLSGAPWTIGFGDTGPDVVPGLVITEMEADIRFAKRLAREFELGVLDALQQNPTQCQYDAFVSLAYNIGLGNFRASTALRKFNMGDLPAAAEAILSWNKAGGKVMKGLQRRRWAEHKVFGGWTAPRAIADALATYP